MRRDEATWRVDGRPLTVHHLDKVFWPEDGFTKGDLLTYYRRMSRRLLPWLRDRPLTLRVFPDGIHGFSYYRRDLPDHAPDFLRSVDYRAATRDRVLQLPLVDDTAGLLWLVDQGAIELHLWGSRAPHLERPDVAVFDLDTGEGTPWERMREAALRLRDALDDAGIASRAKTSGGTGMHVYVGLAPRHDFDRVRAWVKSVAERLAEAWPDLVAVPHGKTHQGDRVLVDYAQNGIGRNTAAPWTVRAHPGAPVSMPLKWAEVEAGGFTPADFTMDTAPERIAHRRDPFAAVLEANQELPEPAAE